METWREAALAEVRGLKPHFAAKYGWNPIIIADEAEEADGPVDLVVMLRGNKLGDKAYSLRLRYQEDWQLAGRREAFVDPDDHTSEGLAHWPPVNAVRGVNPQNDPPAICLRGVYGYHSVLHSNERPTGTTLLGFLLELQKVIDE